MIVSTSATLLYLSIKFNLAVLSTYSLGKWYFMSICVDLLSLVEFFAILIHHHYYLHKLLLVLVKEFNHSAVLKNKKKPMFSCCRGSVCVRFSILIQKLVHLSNNLNEYFVVLLGSFSLPPQSDWTKPIIIFV